MDRPYIVEYRGDSDSLGLPFPGGKHLVEVTRLSAGETYGGHTVNQLSVVVDDIDEVRQTSRRYVLPAGVVRRIERTGCICPACSV